MYYRKRLFTRSSDLFISLFLLVLFAFIGALGCSHILEDATIGKDLKTLSQEFAVAHGDFVTFRGCLSARGGSCSGEASTALPHSSQEYAGLAPGASRTSSTLDSSVAALPDGHPAALAHSVLRSPMSQTAAALHDHLRGHEVEAPGVSSERDAQGHQRIDMNLRVDHLHHFLESLLSTLGIGAWESLHQHCQGLLAGPAAAEERPGLEADCRRIAFVRGYLAAFERHGHFIEVQLQASGTDAHGVSSLVDSAVGEINRGLSNVVQVSSIGFVSRDSSFRARLPALEVVFDPTAKPHVSLTDADVGQVIRKGTVLDGLGVGSETSAVGTGAQLGAQVVRVYLEALFDAAEGLPAVRAANLGGSGPTGLTLGDYSLPLYQSPTGHVDSDDLSRMNFFNNAVATKTRVIVGHIVSGFGPINLNNPPLENAIAEILATTVRKAAEKASWCWYACDLDGVTKELVSTTEDTAKDALHAELHGLQDRRVHLHLQLHR